MSFIMDGLNGIPLVGHVKGVIHYIVGDIEKGNEAIYQSTRSTAVLGGGVIGRALGDPGRAAAVGIIGGAVVDGNYSFLTGKPQGIIGDFANIGRDISEGKFPVESGLIAARTLAIDAVIGLSAPVCVEEVADIISAYSMGKGVAKDTMKKPCLCSRGHFMGKGVAENTGKIYCSTSSVHSIRRRPAKDTVRKAFASQFVVVGMITRVIELHIWKTSDSNKPSTGGKPGNQSGNSDDSSHPEKNNKNSGSKASGSTGKSGGGQPPRDNRNNKKEHYETSQLESHMEIFLSLFGVQSLDEIGMGRNGIQIFKFLTREDIKTLKKVIKDLRSGGYLEIVIKIVRHMFDRLETGDVTFLNFLSLVQFVATYCGEYFTQYMEEEGHSSYEERRQQADYTLLRDSYYHSKRVMETFMSTKRVIELENIRISPNFRDIFSAVYHWYKHRILPNGEVLSIIDYFKLIERLLNRMRNSCMREYLELRSEDHPRREIVYEVVCPILKTRIKIVVKFHNGCHLSYMVLSSCYFVDDFFLGDEEQDEFIDDKYKFKPF